jgi:transcription-repair coupling factor (superfamily II helicase)
VAARPQRQKSKVSASLSDFRDLQVGDYVVHVEHGIGQYQGLKEINQGDGAAEFMVLEYAAAARLYVSLTRLDLVQKYRLSEGAKPVLRYGIAASNGSAAVGDVGYGKTEVAMRAAFKALSDNKQVAVLATITVLAFQHYETFKQRFAPFPLTVEMISRFRTRKQIKEILQKVETGKVDIPIGTHRLVSKDVKFADLGLLLVDEEQRFGVRHKERIKQMRTEVVVLTFGTDRSLWRDAQGCPQSAGIRRAEIAGDAGRGRLPLSASANS